jgi:hypothetical protein
MNKAKETHCTGTLIPSLQPYQLKTTERHQPMESPPKSNFL